LRPRTSSSPLRILIVSERFHPEEFRVNDLARDWAARGHQVRVLTQVPSYPSGRLPAGWRNRARRAESWEGVSIRRVRTVTGYATSLARKLLAYGNFALRASLAALWERPRPQLIFCFNCGPLTSALPGVLAGRLRRVPVLVWIQDLWPDTVWAYGFRRSAPREFLLGGLVRFVYNGADLLLLSSRGFREGLRPFLAPGRRTEYLPNWADELDDRAPSVVLAEGDKFHFMFAGNLGRAQNLDRVLEAFAGLPPDLLARAQLNLVGDGSHAAALRERVAREGMAAVRFWGRVPSREMAGWYRASHVLLVTLDDQPVFRRTVPSKFQTCLAARRPILAAAGDETNRITAEEGIGLAAEAGSVAEIRAAMARFAGMGEDELATMAQRAVRLLERDFHKPRTLERLHAYVEEFARRGRR